MIDHAFSLFETTTMLIDLGIIGLLLRNEHRFTAMETMMVILTRDYTHRAEHVRKEDKI